MKEKLFTITRKDFEVQTFRCGGHGGQHQNKTSSGVRIIHKASGAVGESREERHQQANRRIALERLSKNKVFLAWCNLHSRELIDNETLEEKVKRMMSPENIKVEILDNNNRWVEG